MGLLVYQPFKRVSALHYGVVYFLVIVGMKLLMNLMSGVTEVRGGVVLVHDGRWTLAGAEEKILVAGIEALLSTIVMVILQGILASRRR